ncbi:MAG: RnfABCDGE type electron transport complex subunit G [Gemmatimonadota bacterium]|nr:RnfABCDGE type electron transport complex subunit G [Gemmatimonadota bacterium]MDE3173689.1 RnfABCDGE type electron transport complex subunit G [Gemmatimonadota bacterium]MDE3215399.1 RnfABCDGE type electron transport complex subunit G [Gemmatimonadota bacterium]
MSGPACHVPEPPPAVHKSTPAWRLLLTLVVAGAAAGWLIVSVYNATLPAVERHAAEQVNEAVRQVLKAPARWDTLYLVDGALTSKRPASVNAETPMAFVGYDAGGRRIGAAITAAEPGFQELVTLMIGFDPATGALTGYDVLDQQETPGLGDRIESDTDFTRQFPGRVAPLVGVKRAPATPNEVQTITGATISSRAVVRIINDAVARWRPLLQAYDRGGQE